jgi:2Fe-2S ferredoxin
LPKVTYHLASGEVRALQLPAGQSVMQGAVAAAIPGIDAECGGALTCATCHVHVGDGWYECFPPPGAAESDLLEVVEHPCGSSRLSCQLILTDAMDGLEVSIPGN